MLEQQTREKSILNQERNEYTLGPGKLLYFNDGRLVASFRDGTEKELYEVSLIISLLPFGMKS